MNCSKQVSKITNVPLLNVLNFKMLHDRSDAGLFISPAAVSGTLNNECFLDREPFRHRTHRKSKEGRCVYRCVCALSVEACSEVKEWWDWRCDWSTKQQLIMKETYCKCMSERDDNNTGRESWIHRKALFSSVQLIKHFSITFGSTLHPYKAWMKNTVIFVLVIMSGPRRFPV